MSKLLDLAFQTSADFAQCRSLGANGIFKTGTELPNGIPGRIWIENSICNMYLNTSDASTADWKRTEIDFGEFPTALGEYWTTFEFKREWSFSNYVVIGSWSVMINDVSGQTYVPIGFRIRDQNLVIQAPRDLNVIGFNNQNLAVVPVGVGTWHKVVAHVNLQPDNTGFREVFLDGAPIVRQWGIQTTYPTSTGHYFKIGPYDGDHLAAFEEATLRIRNVAVWTGNDGYQAVMGEVPIIPQRRIAF